MLKPNFLVPLFALSIVLTACSNNDKPKTTTETTKATSSTTVTTTAVSAGTPVVANSTPMTTTSSATAITAASAGKAMGTKVDPNDDIPEKQKY